MSAWSLDHARHTYSIPHWADGYFDVDAQGRMVACRAAPAARRWRCPRSSSSAAKAGLKLPLLLRFSDILGDRLGKLQARLRQAPWTSWDYTGGYTAVYPIKVNQHCGVAGELAAQGGEGFGLEAGTKPELMAVLGAGAARQPGRLQRLQGPRVHPPGADRPQARPADLHRGREAVGAGSW